MCQLFIFVCYYHFSFRSVWPFYFLKKGGSYLFTRAIVYLVPLALLPFPFLRPYCG